MPLVKRSYGNQINVTILGAASTIEHNSFFLQDWFSPGQNVPFRMSKLSLKIQSALICPFVNYKKGLAEQIICFNIFTNYEYIKYKSLFSTTVGSGSLY